MLTCESHSVHGQQHSEVKALLHSQTLSKAGFFKAVNKGLTTINVVESFLIEINFEISYATNIIISSGKTLTLVPGATLKIVDGVTFTGEGEFVNNGTIVQA